MRTAGRYVQVRPHGQLPSLIVSTDCYHRRFKL
jgi:hypothetical protein